MTTRTIGKKKGHEQIVMVTAWDSITARMAAAAGVDMILVGDSLANTALGHANTLPVSLDAMCHHAAAVTRASGETFVVFDMPFLACCGDLAEDVRACGRAIKECGCHAVKMEGAEANVPLVRALVQQGIPVMGHLGLMPQRVHQYGGMFVQGRGDAAEMLINSAKALVDAGIFSLVLECVPEELGRRAATELPVPVIGIGAGRYLDGQVQVLADLLGLLPGAHPKHARQYVNLFETATAAIKQYVDDVREKRFPEKQHTFGET